MSGHSKWSSIKHKKAKTDATRGKVFTKLIREITVAARVGGADPEGNPRLRLAIQAAKSNNMPNDNIQRAIKKGAGEAEGAGYQEITYEGYGAGGVALMIDALTDNRNRTTAEVRHALGKHGGSLGETGCVAWNFEVKGVIRVSTKRVDEETLMGAALEVGADDVRQEGDVFEVTCAPTELHRVSVALGERHIPFESAELERVPNTTVKLDEEGAKKILKMMEALEDLDDVQRVSANFDIPDEILQEG
ncbi:MAG: YebC/PmpR family DNA-binding transcriptional regulator [Candidatus Krumholzibacteria bacterium]|nr:YebC/PmpR family DNA-binding transcriptional regulator [Candidatus Krumholzibacteria bacterium]